MEVDPAEAVRTLERGGTSATNAKGAEYNINGSMSADSAAIADADNIVFKVVSPSATNGVFRSKTMAQMWVWIASKVRSVFGFSASNVLGTSHGGTGNTSGNAPSASKLQYLRTIRTDLASEEAVGFNGSANVTPGVTGVLPLQHGGHGATDGPTACNNIGAVKKAGDKMTGKLYAANGSGVYGADGSWESMAFYDDSDTPKIRGSMMVSDANRFHINQQETGASYAERYMLPEVGSGLTADVWYNILTSKKPVTIAQGGHGATNKKNARKNLGAEIQVGTATVGTTGVAITFPDAFSGIPVVTANGSDQTAIRVTNVTATGCTLTAGTSGNTVQWQAIYISN